MKEISRERAGLYYLLSYHKLPGHKRNTYGLSVKHSSLAGIDQACIELWHKRLGHVPSKVLSHMFPSQTSCIENTMKNCSVCPCARQTR